MGGTFARIALSGRQLSGRLLGLSRGWCAGGGKGPTHTAPACGASRSHGMLTVVRRYSGDVPAGGASRRAARRGSGRCAAGRLFINQ